MERGYLGPFENSPSLISDKIQMDSIQTITPFHYDPF